MFWVIYILCSAVMMWLDYRTVAPIKGASLGKARRRYLAVVWFLDTIPFWSWAIFELWRDNPTWMSMTSMWLNFAYMVAVIARGPFVLALVIGKRWWWRVLGGITTMALATLFFYGMAVTRTDYDVRYVRLESSRLPASFDGYRILQLSDLHIGSMVRPEQEIREIVALANLQQADAVVFSGDLINVRQDEITAPLMAELARLRADDGVFSVVGNHDLGVYVRDSITITPAMTTARLIADEQLMGWQVLDNTSAHIRRGADSISITGISFTQALHKKRHSSHLPETDIEHAYEGTVASTFNLTISHIPQLWDRILELGRADLTLSGHVHSMQIKIPIGQRGISPSRLRYKRWSGLYEEQGRWLYVNDGIGCAMWPMRLGARPEITVFELTTATE